MGNDKKYKCPKCGGNITFGNVSPGYFGECLECDEDMYEFECIEESSGGDMSNYKLKASSKWIKKNARERGETPVYADDINPRIANDAFFGKGFEAMVAEAEAQGDQVIVGYFVKDPFVEK